MPALKKIGAAALSALGFGTGASAVTANYLIVAGGGGGDGSGGGAGGYQANTTSLSLTTSYTVTIGAGGAATLNGSNSSFGTLTASVGGGGGSSGNSNGKTGGSGSGGSQTGTGGAATSGQGNAGGNGGGAGSTGGGGGAGAVGSAGGSNIGGNGGAGSASSISGTSVTYAGGGGGSASSTQGTGGSGGGGSASSTTGSSGTANLGGGGGGGWTVGGGQGGSGIVIISYTGAQQFGGGVVSSAAGNTIHTFYTSGVLSPLSSLSASYLVVAGGGGGGWTIFNTANGGGAGAGGLLSGSATIIDTNSTYVVTVGAGGTTTTTSATSGSNSSFSIVSTTAVGGGAGGNLNGVNGGSGGGGAGAGVTGGTAGTGVSGQGFAGAAGQTSGNFNGGGGGGAAQVGFTNGNGGNGTSSTISGTATFYAGGGGGSAGIGSTTSAGLGGGGTGGAANANGAAGTANTGGGGGGSGYSAGNTTFGGSGGSGIVVIAYAGSTQQMSGGTVTVSGGNVIHTFTSSGYLGPLTNFSNSLRFRGSATAYLSRTPTVVSNRTTYTWSGWIKRGIIDGGEREFFSAYSSGTNYDRFMFFQDNLYMDQISSGSAVGRLTSSALYRDPAAWYHIVCAVDTTQATSSNRLKLYVNGSQVTALATATYPSQNFTGQINNTVLHNIADLNGLGRTCDGYMTNINFIDGQALTPNSFGSFNQYGNWVPVTYGGSYGTNGFFLPFNQVTTSTYAATLNGTNQYVQAGTTATNFICTSTASGAAMTIEAWVYLTAYNTQGSPWMYSPVYAKGGTYFNFGVRNGNLRFYWYDGGFNYVETPSTSDVPLNTWTYVTVTVSGTSIYLFVNGILRYSGTPFTGVSSGGLNQAEYMGIETGGNTYLTGQISNIRVSNAAVYTATFTPPTSPLTVQTPTRLLTLQNATLVDNGPNAYSITSNNSVTTSVATPFTNPYTLCIDQSPQGNNWTPSAISTTSGATYDSMTDVPTLSNATSSNYCVLNPLTRTAGTPSDGNLQFVGPSSWRGINGTLEIPTTGKWYFEATILNAPSSPRSSTSSYNGIGIALATVFDVSLSPNVNNINACVLLDSGYINNFASSASDAGTSIANGDIIGVAINTTSNTYNFYKNNSSVASGTINATAGTKYIPFQISYSGDFGKMAVNFGQRPFTYTPPTDHLALNAFNM